MTRERFWIVWCEDNGSRPPTHRHNAEDSARREAERLAREHTGKTFAVLASIGDVCCAKTSWSNHIDPLPF